MNKIEIKNIPTKGRAVLALQDISKDEIFEVCPVIVIPKDQCDFIEKTILDDYVFLWGENKEDNAVILGYGMMYNHSYTPNAVYIRNLKDQEMNYVALTDIKAGEEITINYNGSPNNMDPLWFDVK